MADVLESTRNLHDAVYPFFEKSDVDCMRTGLLFGPLDRPLCSPRGDHRLRRADATKLQVERDTGCFVRWAEATLDQRYDA